MEIVELIEEWDDGIGRYDELEAIDEKIQRGLNKEEAAKALEALGKCNDVGFAHIKADEILCSMVDDEISDAFSSWGKWYA